MSEKDKAEEVSEIELNTEEQKAPEEYVNKVEDLANSSLNNEELNNNESIDKKLPVEELPIEELSVEEQLKEDLGKEKDKFLRLFAEFENYKKRTSKERIELFKTAGQEVIVSLLPVIDDFDRAIKELAKSDDKEMLKGVELISNKFKETLKNKGLQEMKVKQGDDFDAEKHDAITQIPAPNKKLKGKVVDVIEKGFALGDKIIRHPKVVVGN